ncbi:MAG: hypothetical protein FWG22_02285 [Prolixibacteraceae bacterium]|nr:hypothetical protein [Prolixibacteraceae bacterium]
MDLSLTMRYVLVQARKAAGGSNVFTEHIFGEILELSRKDAADIAKDPETREAAEKDIAAIVKILEYNKIDVDSVSRKLRSLLQSDLQKAEEDVKIVLGKAVLAGGKQGKPEVFAADVLTLILLSPTPLINQSIASPPENKATDEPADTILFGYDTEATLFHPIAEENPPQPVVKAKEELPKEPEPKPQPKPAPPVEKPKPQPRPQPEKPSQPVFFETPKVNAAVPSRIHKGGSGMGKKAKKASRRTKICGINFRGGVAWAAVKYFLLTLLLPIVGTAVAYFGSTQENQFAAKGLAVLGLTLALFGIIFILRGVVSLIGRRFNAFSVFMLFFMDIGYALAIVFSIYTVLDMDILPVYAKILICAYTILALVVAMVKMLALQKSVAGKNNYMNSAAMRLNGTSGIMFFTYMLRVLFPVILIFSIIYIFNLHASAFWHAAFSIAGFLLGLDAIRMALLCSAVGFARNSQAKMQRLFESLLYFYWIFLIPVLSLFIIWYFDGFPLKKWVILIYSLYGFFSLLLIIAYFGMKKE